MITRASVVAALVVLLAGCGQTVAGTPTWPGAKLDRAVLTAADLPAGVQYDRIDSDSPTGSGAGGPPAMLSSPAGCSDGLTRIIEDSAERGPGSAAQYVAAYDGARIVMTVLTWSLDLGQLAATAARCEKFEAFFDPSDQGIPIATIPLSLNRPDALAYQQTMTLGGADSSVYFAFTNVGSMAVFGMAFPTQNPAISAKATLPQTFLDIVNKQADRAQVQ
jgi:hypothetical protein